MNLAELDLLQASRMYMIANTPLFLVRKLQEDPAVRAISERYSGEEIVDALRVAVATDPADAREAVQPYALLVALSFKPTIDHLQQAVAGIATDQYEWYEYIAQVLLQAFSPVEKSVIEIPGTLSNPTVSSRSDSPSNVTIINISDDAA